MALVSRAVRVTVGAALVFAALYIPYQANAADAREARLPAALSKVDAIKRIYPDLHMREMARKDGRSWERLRRAARTEWMRTHPCADATLERRYRLGAVSSWSTVEATWACMEVPAPTRAFYTCIADHEGGRAYPDVRFGGGRGYPGVSGAAGNVVFGHFQIRPGWYRGAMEGRPGTYAGDYWTSELHGFAADPVNQARLVLRIGPDQFATRGRCQ